MDILKNDNIFAIYNYLEFPESISCLNINTRMNAVTEEYLLINKHRYRTHISNYIGLLKLLIISKKTIILTDTLYHTREVNQHESNNIKNNNFFKLLLGYSVTVTGLLLYFIPQRTDIRTIGTYNINLT
jgi:hypothetical protein